MRQHTFYKLVLFFWLILPAGKTIAQVPDNLGYAGFYDTNRKPGFHDVFLFMGMDGHSITYHNLTYLPREYMAGFSLGTYLPFIRSGTEYSLGFQTQFQYATSLTLENVKAIAVPVYLVAKAGMGNQTASEQPVGFGAGAGLEYLGYNNPHNGPGISQARPSAMLEATTKALNMNIFVRYSVTLTSDYFTKRTVSIGTVLMF